MRCAPVASLAGSSLSSPAAWRHLQSCPLTEADLPRAIEVPKEPVHAGEPAAPAATTEPAAAVHGKVPRRPTIDVVAVPDEPEAVAM